MAGNVLSKTFSRTCPDRVKNSQKKYETSSFVELGKLKSSSLFDSPSTVSALMFGRSSNGLRKWKNRGRKITEKY